MTGNDLLHLADTLRKERREHPMAWHSKFVEMGGYDCMTDAIRIFSGDAAVASLDLNYFGQERCKENPEARAMGEQYAAEIVAAVNSYSEAREAAFSKLATAAHAAYGLLEEFGIGTAEGRVAEALRQAFKAVEDASK